MKKETRKRFVQIFIGFLLITQGIIMAQPTPGDGNTGAMDDGVVGGGADLGINIWFIPILALLYFIYKRRDSIFRWYLNLDWGEYS